MRPVYFLGLAVVGAGAFLAGRFVRPAEAPQAVAGARRILHYHDPMHPAYKSDKPGIAPDCGMQLEPVYAGEDGQPMAEPSTRPADPGTVQISSDKQQLMGIRLATVQRSAAAHTLRVTGRVVPDETRTYRINAA